MRCPEGAHGDTGRPKLTQSARCRKRAADQSPADPACAPPCWARCAPSRLRSRGGARDRPNRPRGLRRIRHLSWIWSSAVEVARCMAASWFRSEHSSLRNASRIPLLDIMTCLLRDAAAITAAGRRIACTGRNAAGTPRKCPPPRSSGFDYSGASSLEVLNRRMHLPRRGQRCPRGVPRLVLRDRTAGPRGDDERRIGRSCVGPHGCRQVERPAWRGGSVDSQVTLGGRRLGAAIATGAECRRRSSPGEPPGSRILPSQRPWRLRLRPRSCLGCPLCGAGRSAPMPSPAFGFMTP